MAPPSKSHGMCQTRDLNILACVFSSNLIITSSFWYYNLCVYHSSITWILYCSLCCQIDKISLFMSFSLKITISEVMWWRYDVITPSRDLRNVWHNCINFSRGLTCTTMGLTCTTMGLTCIVSILNRKIATLSQVIVICFNFNNFAGKLGVMTS